MAKRSDPAHRETDKILKELEKKIDAEYRQAHKEVSEKLDDYLRRFQIKDKKWQEWVASGKKKNSDYVAWRKGQMIMGNRWAALKDQMASTYADAAAVSQKLANGTMPEIYAINHDYATFEVEKQCQRDTMYTLYNREAVADLLKDDPTFYHAPGATVRDKIARGEVKAWNKQHIQSVMIQGILQGESIPNLTKRLEKVTGGDHAAAIRNARTMATGVQNKGRTDAYKRAEEKGVDMEQMWLATHDERTRHWHRELDQVKVKVGQPWHNYEDIRYPGDPLCSGGNIYNCRCTVRGVVKGLERQAYKMASDKDLGGMTYEEWRESKKSKSNPITLPEEKAESIKRKYIKEYRER